MSGYAQLAADTLEYQQGYNSAEINIACAYGPQIRNPYPSNSKQWLDWQIGYESWNNSITEIEETNTLFNNPTLLCPIFTPRDYWDAMGYNYTF